MKRNAHENRYVSMTPKDQQRFRENTLVLQAVQTYLYVNFSNREKVYFYVKNQRIQTLSFLFKSKHFQHLCGFKYERGAKTFWRELVHGRVNIHQLKVLKDGTTWQKIRVLEQLYALGTLDVQITEGGVYLYSDYTNSMISVRHKIFQLLLAEDNDPAIDGQFPFSLRNLQGDSHRLPIGYPVIGVLDLNSQVWMAIDIGYRRPLELLKKTLYSRSSPGNGETIDPIERLITENKSALDDMADR